MKNQILAIAILAGVIGMLAWTMTHKPVKIGYVETSILMEEFSESIKAKKQFEKSQKEWDKNLKTLNDSLMASMTQMKSEYDRAKPDRQKELRANFQKRQDDYQRYVDVIKKMSQDMERELMDPVIKKANAFLDLWGKQHGFGLLLGTTNGGNILQADPSLNLTSEIVKALNDQYRDLPLAPNEKEKSKQPDTILQKSK